MQSPHTQNGESRKILELRRRACLGHARIDDLTFAEAIECIAGLVARRRGGTVYTLNVDHLVLLEEDAHLREAYAGASLVFAGGWPIVWASRLIGTPVRAEISSADLLRPLLRRAAEERWRVYLVGGGEGVAERAAERMTREVSALNIVGIDARPGDGDWELDRDSPAHDELVAGVVSARADLVVIALDSPAQEIVMHRIGVVVRPAVCIGVGAGLELFAGASKRAPDLITAAGLDWLFRFAHESRQLWCRHFVRDPRFALILLRQLRWSVL